MKIWLLIAVLVAGWFSSGANAQNIPQRFAINRSISLDSKVVSTETHNRVKVYDMTYASAEGRVPAYLVVPKGPGKFAAIVWAHWLMPGSTLQNRKEFLNEAVALAPAGVISLLIDAPQNRPGFVEEADPLGSQRPRLVQEEVVSIPAGLRLWDIAWER